MAQSTDHHPARRPRRRWLRWVLWPVGVVVVAAAVLGVELGIALSRDRIDDPEYEIDRVVPGAGEPLRLVVLGDSTVAGLGAATIEDTLPVQLAEQVAERTGRAVHVVAHGVSGARTKAVLEEQLLLVERADVLVVEVGSNDVTHRTGLDELGRDTRDLLEGAGERAQVVVLGSAGRLDTPNFLRPLRDLVMWRATKVRELQGREVGRLDGDRFGFVDMGDEVDREYDRTPGASSSDDFHPAGPGYGVWARALATEVVERLPDRDG